MKNMLKEKLQSVLLVLAKKFSRAATTVINLVQIFI